MGSAETKSLVQVRQVLNGPKKYPTSLLRDLLVFLKERRDKQGVKTHPTHVPYTSTVRRLPSQLP